MDAESTLHSLTLSDRGWSLYTPRDSDGNDRRIWSGPRLAVVMTGARACWEERIPEGEQRYPERAPSFQLLQDMLGRGVRGVSVIQCLCWVPLVATRQSQEGPVPVQELPMTQDAYVEALVSLRGTKGGTAERMADLFAQHGEPGALTLSCGPWEGEWRWAGSPPANVAHWALGQLPAWLRLDRSAEVEAWAADWPRPPRGGKAPPRLPRITIQGG